MSYINFCLEDWVYNMACIFFKPSWYQKRGYAGYFPGICLLRLNLYRQKTTEESLKQVFIRFELLLVCISGICQ
jgi:hypothetical protein